jgi:hypothetical protein
VCRVRLRQHAILAAAVAGDPHEPRREGTERLGQGLGGRGQRLVAIAAPGAEPGVRSFRRGVRRLVCPRVGCQSGCLRLIGARRTRVMCSETSAERDASEMPAEFRRAAENGWQGVRRLAITSDAEEGAYRAST